MDAWHFVVDAMVWNMGKRRHVTSHEDMNYIMDMTIDMCTAYGYCGVVQIQLFALLTRMYNNFAFGVAKKIFFTLLRLEHKIK